MTMSNTSISENTVPITTCCSCGEEMSLPQVFNAYPLCDSCASLLMHSCIADRESDGPIKLDLLRQRMDASPLFAAWFLHAAELVLENEMLNESDQEALKQEMAGIRRRYGPAIYPVFYYLGQHMNRWDKIYDAIWCYSRVTSGIRRLVFRQYHDPTEYHGLLAKTNLALTELIGEEDLDVWDNAAIYAQANLVHAEALVSEAKCYNQTTDESHRQALEYLVQRYDKLLEKLPANSPFYEYSGKLRRHVNVLREHCKNRTA